MISYLVPKRQKEIMGILGSCTESITALIFARVGIGAEGGLVSNI